jgi:hypothetical protein
MTPAGRLPMTLNPGAGEPVVVTVKEPIEPTVNVVLLALVIDGGAPMLMLTLTV